jgi:hypothetical protein
LAVPASVVADVSAQRKVALVSVLVLGATQLRPRAREPTLQLVEELYARIPETRSAPATT